MSRKHILNPLDTVAPGENPRGYVAQTSNETVRVGNSEINSQWPWGLQADGPRWNAPMPEPMTIAAVPIAVAKQKRRRPDK